jgi:hypothetical protein
VQPKLLALLLCEVGVAGPEVLSSLLEYHVGTTTTIRIDIGHSKMSCSGRCGVFCNMQTVPELMICER